MPLTLEFATGNDNVARTADAAASGNGAGNAGRTTGVVSESALKELELEELEGLE